MAVGNWCEMGDVRNGGRTTVIIGGRLENPAFFGLARVDYGTVTWPSEVDIAPETLYDCSENMGTQHVDDHEAGMSGSA